MPTYRGPETGESGSWGPRLSDLEYSTDSNIYNATNTAGNFGNAFDTDGNYRWDNNGFLVPSGLGNGTPANDYNKLNSNDFFRAGLSLTNNISVSGSNETITYRFSASDLDQEGVVPNENYKRRTFNLGATLKANDKLSFETAINYTRSDYDRIQQGSNTSGLLLGLYRTPASFDNSNGLGTGARDNATAYEFADRSQRNYRGGGGYDNPYWVINNAPGIEEVHRVFGNFKTNYVVNDWINLGVNVGIIGSIIAIVQLFKQYIPEKLVVFAPILLSVVAFFVVGGDQPKENVLYWAAAAGYLWKLANVVTPKNVLKSKTDLK